MRLLWEELRDAVPLIVHGNPYLLSVVWFTIQLALVATAAAIVIGVPVALAIGLGRFPGRRALHVIANASLGLPPVLVGLFLYFMFVPQGPLGSLQLMLTRRAIFVAQTILALPYIVALSAAALRALPSGLLDQARLLGAGRRQLALLALREARIGILAAVIAGLGTSLSEVGAILIVGGNIYGYDQTLASAALFEANMATYDDAIALGIVLSVLILALMGGLAVVQQRTDGLQFRFRTAT